MSVFFIILEISGNDERRFWKIAKMEATRNSKRQGTILTTTTLPSSSSPPTPTTPTTTTAFSFHLFIL